MRAADNKPLPTIVGMRRRLLAIVNDHRLAEPSSTTVPLGELEGLAIQIEDAFGLSQGKAFGAVRHLAGLPRRPDVWHLAVDTLLAWLPALKAGHSYAPRGSREFLAVPHTLRLLDPEPVPDKGRWQITVAAENGPMEGWRERLEMPHSMACRMVVAAMGRRTAYSLDNPRPCDLHNLRILALLGEIGKGLGIGRVLNSSAILKLNQPYKRRYSRTDCAQGAGVVCEDCGRGQAECGMARHTEPLAAGRCACCGRDAERTTTTGVCTECLNRSIKLGIPLTAARRRAAAPAETPSS